jgi:hypothetical protein
VKALVEKGDVEITSGKGSGELGGSSKGLGPSQGGRGAGGDVYHTGER